MYYLSAMRMILVFLLFCKAVSVPAQTIITQVKEINPLDKGVYIFPKILVRGNTVATENINTYLQNDLLLKANKPFRKSMFENVWQTEERSIALLRDIEYAVVADNPQFFSLRISAEGCGAYCEFFNRHFSFDLKTGKPVTIKQIFSTNGLDMLYDSLHLWTVKLLDKQIRAAEDSLKKPSVQKNAAAKEKFETIRNMYDQCYLHELIPDLDGIDFKLTKTNILFFLDRCSGHADRALDELDVIVLNIPIATWKTHLTSYGKKLLLN